MQNVLAIHVLVLITFAFTSLLQERVNLFAIAEMYSKILELISKKSFDIYPIAAILIEFVFESSSFFI